MNFRVFLLLFCFPVFASAEAPRCEGLFARKALTIPAHEEPYAYAMNFVEAATYTPAKEPAARVTYLREKLIPALELSTDFLKTGEKVGLMDWTLNDLAQSPAFRDALRSEGLDQKTKAALGQELDSAVLAYNEIALKRGLKPLEISLRKTFRPRFR